MSRRTQRRRMALSSPKLFKSSFGSVMVPSPSARARPGGGLAHAFHDRSLLRRIHALLYAVARTADQREYEDNDHQDAQTLIPQTSQHPTATCGRWQGRKRESHPRGLEWTAAIAKSPDCQASTRKLLRPGRVF